MFWLAKFQSYQDTVSKQQNKCNKNGVKKFTGYKIKLLVNMKMGEQKSSEEQQLKNAEDAENTENAALIPSGYQMKPSLNETFKTSKIKEIIQNTMTNCLQNKTYNSNDARVWTKEIADQVNTAVRDLKMRRYKHVVQVTIGQQMGSGCRYIARCRWDAECDNQTSDIFTNTSLFCICTVFGVYLY